MPTLGQLFNDANQDNIATPSEILSAEQKVNKVQVDAGQIKYLPQQQHSSYFQLRQDASALTKVVLLKVNPQPQPIIKRIDNSQSQLSINFAQWVDDFTLSDVTVDNAVADSLSIDGDGYLLQLKPSDSNVASGLVTVSLAADVVSDVAGAGNFAASLQWPTKPVVTMSAPSVSSTSAGPMSVDLSFNFVDDFELMLASLSLQTTGDAAGTISIENGSTLTPTVVVSDISGNGSMVLVLNQGAGSDKLGKQTAPVTSSAVQVSNVVISNQAPTISGTPATQITVGQAYHFAPSANDSDVADSLTFSITNKPNWADFASSSGVLSGTPSADDVAAYADIVIAVSDSLGASASLAAFNIEVKVAVSSGGNSNSNTNTGNSTGGSGGGGSLFYLLLMMLGLIGVRRQRVS